MTFDTNLILYVIGFVAGITGVPVINLIKDMLGAYGKYAMSVAVVLCVGLAAAVVFVSGLFTGATFDLDTMMKVSTEVFSVATILFKALQTDKKPSG